MMKDDKDIEFVPDTMQYMKKVGEIRVNLETGNCSNCEEYREKIELLQDILSKYMAFTNNIYFYSKELQSMTRTYIDELKPVEKDK